MQHLCDDTFLMATRHVPSVTGKCVNACVFWSGNTVSKCASILYTARKSVGLLGNKMLGLVKVIFQDAFIKINWHLIWKPSELITAAPSAPSSVISALRDSLSHPFSSSSLFLSPSAVILEKQIRIPRSLSVKAASVLKGFLNKVRRGQAGIIPCWLLMAPENDIIMALVNCHLSLSSFFLLCVSIWLSHLFTLPQVHFYFSHHPNPLLFYTFLANSLLCHLSCLPFDFLSRFSLIVSCCLSPYFHTDLPQDPKERLGCHPQTGFADIMGHPFFRNVDWDLVSHSLWSPVFLGLSLYFSCAFGRLHHDFCHDLKEGNQCMPVAK